MSEYSKVMLNLLGGKKMLKKRIPILVLISGLVLSTFLGGCAQTQTSQTSTTGQASTPPIEITFVNSVTTEDATKQATLDVIKEFEKENPGIKVKNVPVPVSDELNQLTIMTMGGNAPDVAQMHGDNNIALAAMGALAPLDGLLSQNFVSDLNKSSYDLGLYKGKHYAVPWINNPLGLIYNKKIMQQAGLDPNKPPKTMDELTADMAIIKQKLPNVVPLQLDTTVRTIGLEQEWAFMKSFGATPVVLGKDGYQVQADKMKPFAEWLRDIVKKGYTLPGKKFGEFRPLGAQNRLAFGFDTPFFKGTVQSIDKSITDDKFNETWGVTTLPVGPDNTPYSAPDDNNLGIFAASKHKEAAAKFAEFFASSDYALKTFFAPLGFLPEVKSAATRMPKEFGDPVRKAFMDVVVPHIQPLPWGPDYPKMATVIMAGVQEIISTDKSIPDILNQMQTKLDGIVKGQ